MVNSFSEKETGVHSSTMPALKCINNSALLGFVLFLTGEHLIEKTCAC